MNIFSLCSANCPRIIKIHENRQASSYLLYLLNYQPFRKGFTDYCREKKKLLWSSFTPWKLNMDTPQKKSSILRWTPKIYHILKEVFQLPFPNHAGGSWPWKGGSWPRKRGGVLTSEKPPAEEIGINRGSFKAILLVQKSRKKSRCFRSSWWLSHPQNTTYWSNRIISRYTWKWLRYKVKDKEIWKKHL